MSLEFMDGFDHYSAASWIQKKWDGSSEPTGAYWTFAAGRFGGDCIVNTSYTNMGLMLTATQLTNQATRVVGFALQVTNTIYSQVNGGSGLLSFLDGATAQVQIGLDKDGSLWVVRDPTNTNVVLFHSAAGVIPVNNWVYVEAKLTVGSSVGAFDIHVGGTSVASGTGVNTQTSSNATSNGIQLANPQSYGYGAMLDDVYVLNAQGSANNNFLGECQILTTLPTADGSNLAMTPNSGTAHFSRVNEATPDSDTSYVSSNMPGATDTYKFAAISPTGLIAAVQTVVTARKDQAGARSLAGATKSGSATTAGPAIALPSTYGMLRQLQETDPNTSTAWTASGVNAAEFGARVS